MKKIAVALIAFSFILTSCTGAGFGSGNSNQVVNKTNAHYINYSEGVLSKTDGNKVLFFHAAWCGSCKSASKNITESVTTPNLTIFKLDYDSNTELKKKYEINSQHTFVQVDKEGKMITKWGGSKSIADIQKNIKTYTEPTMVMNDKKGDVETKTNKEKVLDLAHKMEKDGMNEVKSLYPDLKFVKTIAKEDTLNLMGMMEEEWLYSSKNDVTVVVCKSMNTPSYIFDGKNMSDTELVKVKGEMKKMMDDMSGDHTEEFMMKKEGKFVTYSADEVANTEGTKILFFHAKWCPACTGAAKNLSASTAPEGLNVFKVDYDTATNLKKKYGIVGQHTFVQIDENGKMLKRWFGSRNYKDILAQL